MHFRVKTARSRYVTTKWIQWYIESSQKVVAVKCSVTQRRTCVEKRSGDKIRAMWWGQLSVSPAILSPILSHDLPIKVSVVYLRISTPGGEAYTLHTIHGDDLIHQMSLTSRQTYNRDSHQYIVMTSVEAVKLGRPELEMCVSNATKEGAMKVNVAAWVRRGD